MSTARNFPQKSFASTFTGKRSSPIVATQRLQPGERPPALTAAWE